ncbi:MAG: site-specific DNA-methyltransferase [Bacteroidales bacterium]|nr:site-specific DNA-methyltransferase [Bacteroidales bacterium]
MEKMKFETPDMTQMNIEKIAALFPNCITEKKDDSGKITKAVNFDTLKQILGDSIADGDESYEFTWVGKRDAMVEAAKPIRKTLRPCVEESVNFDTTENLYIEGDNLEALKLLQEGYLGKVKMIYIDPPYNTGNDFIYKDDFRMDSKKYDEESGAVDDEGNRMVQNSDSNGRFHSDWCSMIYSRLLLARNLLTDDGVIFISIDDNEVENLIKIADETFGHVNHVGTIIVKSNPRGSMSSAEIADQHEFLLLYSKDRQNVSIVGHELSDDMTQEYKLSDENGKYRLLGLRMRGGFWRRTDRPKLYYPIYINPNTGSVSLEKNEIYCEEAVPMQPSTMEDGTWRWSQEKVRSESNLLIGKLVSRGNQQVWDVFQKDYLNRSEGRRTKTKSIWDDSEMNYQNGTVEVKNLLAKGGVFDYSKPVYLLTQSISMIGMSDGDIVLDFFSGSATTAHAVMQQNLEDGRHRKFILVQLPEKCADDSEAAKAGYKNICEIGKERIRRAGAKILAEKQAEQEMTAAKNDLFNNPDHQPQISNHLDIGFRVLKIDDSNMKDVYYSAGEVSQQNLLDQISNIKEDRTDMDLLFGCLVDWGVSLSLPIKTETIEGVSIHNVNDGDLIASFSENIPETVIRQIAAKKPLRVVFRDSSFRDAPSKINVTEIFKTLSPNTTVKVI